MGWHHAECWREHGACSACGHKQVSGASAQDAKASEPSEHVPQGSEGVVYGLGMLTGLAIKHRVGVVTLLFLASLALLGFALSL